jgi:alpha-tubulin suppressor-like RCC1 family protein
MRDERWSSANGLAIVRSREAVYAPAHDEDVMIESPLRNTASPIQRAALCWIIALFTASCATRAAAPGPSARTAAPSPIAASRLLSSGPEYSCAVSAGHVYCWGHDDEGQLGPGPKTDRARATRVPDVDDAVGLHAGEGIACAIVGTGGVRCWGDVERTHAIPGLTDAVDVAASFRLVCAVRRNGHVSCAGLPWRYGGDAKQEPIVSELPGVDDAIGIGSTRRETCIVRRSGALACFPSDAVPGRADPKHDRVPPLEVKPFTGIDGIAQIEGNYDLFCAALRNGQVACWKDITAGAGARERQPQLVVGLADAAAVSLGMHHKCAVRRDGGVRCWGSDNEGMLGSLTLAPDDKTPEPVQDLADAVGVSVGTGFACARKRSGAIVCWGSAHYGQLGNGQTGDANTPVEVPHVTGAVAIAAGKGFSCALDQSGVVWCWGQGDWSSSPTLTPPHPVPPLAGGTRLRAEEDWLFVTRGDGMVGMLVLRDLIKPDRVTAWVPSGLETATAVSATYEEGGSAVLMGGQVVHWQPDTNPAASSVVVPIAGLKDGVDVAGGRGAACVVRRSGHVTCVVPRDRPYGAKTPPPDLIEVPGVIDAVAIGANEDAFAVVGRSGRITRWRLSDDIDAHEDFGVMDVAAVTLGHEFICARTRDGRASCFGDNSFGQLGCGGSSGGIVRSWAPVSGLTDAIAIAAGIDHACAVRRDGHVVCWGNNAQGQVGSPTPPFVSRPVRVVGLGD